MSTVHSYVRPALRAVPVAAPLQTPRVFTGDFQERLARLNHAERELRAMGLHVNWTRLAGPLPQAHIHRDTSVSISPLLDRMGPRSFRPEGDATVISGEFKGVIVSWLEPGAVPGAAC